MKPRAWIIALLVGAASLRAQDDLPRHAQGEALDFEPKLMLDGPHAALPDASPTPASPEDRVSQLQAALITAEQRAADSEQLFKEGILAKVEAEGRALHVVEVRKELADATVAVAASRTDAVKKAFDAHQASQSDLNAANSTLKTAQDTAASASADWAKAELDAATLDLHRKQKLYSEGVCTKREVEIAQDRVALLTSTSAK
jgi:hypothetical protein